MINSSTDLSHHRTYRSVYGGSLVYTYLSIIIRERYKSKVSQGLVIQRVAQNRAIGDSPVAFSCVRKLPGLALVYS